MDASNYEFSEKEIEKAERHKDHQPDVALRRGLLLY